MRENRRPARNTRTSSKKIIVLAAAAIIAAVCGTWLLAAPMLEQGYVDSVQGEMIEDMMRDIHEAEIQRLVDITITDGFDFAEGYGGTAYEPTAYDSAGYMPADYEPAVCGYTVYEPTAYEPEPTPPPAFDPIPDNAFPNAITGIGILTIESINLRLPIAEGIEYATLRIAPGRVPQTAQIGDIGNAVIAGHRNFAFGSMFNRLGEVAVGDLIGYQARNGELMEFEVFEIAVIEPHDQIAFIQPVSEAIITLYTCTPIREATHRLIIRAQRVS
jgi:sortase A